MAFLKRQEKWMGLKRPKYIDTWSESNIHSITSQGNCTLSVVYLKTEDKWIESLYLKTEDKWIESLYLKTEDKWIESLYKVFWLSSSKQHAPNMAI